MKIKQKILITGAGGFLGSYVAKELLKHDYEVHSFSRKRYNELDRLGVIQHQGDLGDLNSLKISLQNIDGVIHCASKVGMNGNYKDFYQANVIGTRNLISAMKELNIQKLVYTSTPSVVFGKDDLINADESAPYPKKFLSTYAQTKMLSEIEVLAANSESFWTVSLRPHLIFGPGDLNLIPRIVEARKKNKLKIVGNGKNLVDVIYVENAATAHRLAFEKLKANSKIRGQAYFIGQGPVNLWDFTNSLLKKYSLPPVTKKIPVWMAFYIGAIIEFFLFITNQKNIHPPMSRFIALQLGKSHYFNHKKSFNDLGFNPDISIDEALERTVSDKFSPVNIS